MRRTALCAAILALALPAAGAQAATGPDPIGSGSTALTLAAPFKRLLAAHGVTLRTTAPATRRGASYALPVAEGEVEPEGSSLAIESAGSLVFSRGSRKVVFRHVSVRTTGLPLLAKVGGGQLKIASAGARKFARAGFGSAFTASGLRLTAKVATRLSKKLRLRDVFERGQRLGILKTTASPATVAVEPSGRASLSVDPAFAAKLDSNFISLNPVAPAERLSSTLFTVPFIPGGTIAPDATAGVPRTGGSLEFLLLGSGQLFWHELWLDLGARQVLAEADIEPTPTYPGKLGQLPVLEIDPASAAVASDPRARTVGLTGARLSLSPTGASELNQALAGGKPTFQAGETFGSVAFEAATR